MLCATLSKNSAVGLVCDLLMLIVCAENRKYKIFLEKLHPFRSNFTYIDNSILFYRFLDIIPADRDRPKKAGYPCLS